MLVLVIYVIKQQKYNELPYFMLLFGIFYMLRGIFSVLTPFGNPAPFRGHCLFAYQGIRL